MERFTHYVPFMALMSASPPPNRPMLTRLIEQGIVAVAAAFISLYISNVELKTQIAALNDKVVEMNKTQEALHRDLNAALEKIRDDIYVPANGKRRGGS